MNKAQEIYPRALPPSISIYFPLPVPRGGAACTVGLRVCVCVCVALKSRAEVRVKSQETVKKCSVRGFNTGADFMTANKKFKKLF